MQLLWSNGPLFVRDMLAFMPEPKPHFNTVSTFVRILEEKGFIGHEAFGKTYRYRAVVSEEEYRNKNLKALMTRFFNNSAKKLVSTLVEEHDLSVDDLQELLDFVNSKSDKS